MSYLKNFNVSLHCVFESKSKAVQKWEKNLLIQTKWFDLLMASMCYAYLPFIRCKHVGLNY